MLMLNGGNTQLFFKCMSYSVDTGFNANFCLKCWNNGLMILKVSTAEFLNVD